jgi:cell division protein FtsL
MLNIKDRLILLILFAISFVSSLALVLQTYEYRNSFSNLDKLKLQKEDLSFKSGILIEEVQYYKNHISLRDVAINSLGMRLPTVKERFVVIKGDSP